MKSDSQSPLGNKNSRLDLPAIGLALLCGAALGLSFPPTALWPLILFALVPLFATLRGATFLQGTGRGFLAGLLYFGLALFWVKNTMTDFGHLPLALALLANFAMVSILALYPALFGYLYCRMAARRGEATALAFAPFLWVALEFLRGQLGFLAFPWLRVAEALYALPIAIQIADIAGEEGVGGVILFVNAALYLCSRYILERDEGTPFPWRMTTSATVLVAATLIYGAHQMETYGQREGEKVTVALLQGNIDQKKKWDPGYRDYQLTLYSGMTREAATKGAKVVIWPEASAPFYYGKGSWRDFVMDDLAASTGAILLFGAPYYEEGSNGHKTAFNRAWALTPGRERDRFDKVHLVPFGEYVPLKSILYFLDKMVTAIGDMAPGQEVRPVTAGAWRPGFQICYEIIFPAYSRRLSVGGADMLVNITNDSWYGPTAASEQSLAMAVFRAVENRRPLLRAAQTGVSAVVGPDGVIEGATPLFTQAILYGEIVPGGPVTWYARTGDLFNWLAVMVALVGLTPSGWPRRRDEE